MAAVGAARPSNPDPAAAAAVAAAPAPAPAPAPALSVAWPEPGPSPFGPRALLALQLGTMGPGPWISKKASILEQIAVPPRSRTVIYGKIREI